MHLVEVPGLPPGPAQNARIQAESSSLACQAEAELPVHEQQPAARVRRRGQRGGHALIAERAAAIEQGDVPRVDCAGQGSTHALKQRDERLAAMVDRRLVKGFANRLGGRHRPGQQTDCPAWPKNVFEFSLRVALPPFANLVPAHAQFVRRGFPRVASRAPPCPAAARR